MLKYFHVRGLGALLGLGVSCVSFGQAYTPPPPPLVVDPCAARPAGSPALSPLDPKAKPIVCPAVSAPAAKGSSTAEQFPFPGDAGASRKTAPADAFPFPGDAGAKPSGGKPTAGAGKGADAFPYPGESSTSPDAVPEGNTPRYVPDAPSGTAGRVPAGGDSSSSSSSSSSDDTTDPAVSGANPDKPADADPDGKALPKGRRRLAKVSALSPDERVTEDLDVAKFYTDRGNFQAAYLRTKDAIKAMPDDAESHFALARAAEKLQKKDEAAAEYALYLKLDPAGDKIVAARRALAQLR